MAPEFRTAGPGDVATIGALADRIWRAAYGGMLPAGQIEYMLRWMYAPHKIAGEMAAGVRYELVLADGNPCGYLALELARPEETAWLHKLYLDPARHGCGWGQLLLGRAENLAREGGAKEILLRVNKGNERALRAYYRFGFVQTATDCADIGGGYSMDDFILRRPVRPRQSDQGEA
jgi:GNAT superfamily N-acetyltransferase